MALTAGRFYFYRNRLELKDHPLNGSVVTGAGPAVDPVAFNKTNASDWDRRRTEITIWDEKTRKEVKVTTAQFGGESVLVKEWWPNVDARSSYFLVPAVTKSGVFEDDVRSGYYKQSRQTEQEFGDDHLKWVIDQGVPSQYAPKLVSYAWQQGHSAGFEDVLNVSYDLVDIFK